MSKEYEKKNDEMQPYEPVQEPVEAEVVDEDNVVKLSRPLANGADSLRLDFDKLNGYALIGCEKRAKKEDRAITMPVLSNIYLAHVAAVAAGVKYDDILNLTGPDFTAVTLKVQGFLTASGLT